MPVDQCVYTGQRFDQLLAIARQRSLDIEALGDATGAGRGCRMCRPYLQQMLAAGHTQFEPLPLDALPGSVPNAL